MALEVVDQLARSSAVDLIVVDSVAALTPRAEIEGEIGLFQVGAHAEVTTGGNALKFYASVRMDIRRTEVIRGEGGGTGAARDSTSPGIRVRVKIGACACAKRCACAR